MMVLVLSFERHYVVRVRAGIVHMGLSGNLRFLILNDRYLVFFRNKILLKKNVFLSEYMLSPYILRVRVIYDISL